MLLLSVSLLALVDQIIAALNACVLVKNYYCCFCDIFYVPLFYYKYVDVPNYLGTQVIRHTWYSIKAACFLIAKL